MFEHSEYYTTVFSVVLAKKAYAEKMTEDSGMTYKLIKGSDVMDREYRKLFE